MKRKYIFYDLLLIVFKISKSSLNTMNVFQNIAIQLALLTNNNVTLEVYRSLAELFR